MRLSIRNDFALGVPEAFEMLTDPAFIEAVAHAAQPQSYEVQVAGRRVRVRRTFPTTPPLELLAGPVVTLTEETVWDEPDGPERTAHTRVGADGLPAAYRATVRLYPGGRGALLDYDGDIAVHVPFLGPKLEEQAAPLLRKAIEVQQVVADDWKPRSPD